MNDRLVISYLQCQKQTRDHSLGNTRNSCKKKKKKENPMEIQDINKPFTKVETQLANKNMKGCSILNKYKQINKCKPKLQNTKYHFIAIILASIFKHQIISIAYKDMGETEILMYGQGSGVG